MCKSEYKLIRKMQWDGDVLKVQDTMRDVLREAKQAAEDAMTGEVLSHFECDFSDFREYMHDKIKWERKQELAMPRWIPVTERLPEDGKTVFVYDGDVHIAKLEKGISAEERERMKNGALPDPVETVWNLSAGYFQVHRSESIKQCDESGNNERPYCWRCHGGVLFGQNVKYWMPLPEPPKEGENV